MFFVEIPSLNKDDLDFGYETFLKFKNNKNPINEEEIINETIKAAFNKCMARFVFSKEAKSKFLCLPKQEVKVLKAKPNFNDTSKKSLFSRLLNIFKFNRKGKK